MKRYIERYGKTFKVLIDYSLGGLNWATSEQERRGYYFSVSPVVLTKTPTYTSESYRAFTGVKKCILVVRRQSKSALAKAEALIGQKDIDEMIDYVSRKNNYVMNK